jgi:hypothetical protein
VLAMQREHVFQQQAALPEADAGFRGGLHAFAV